MNDRIRIIREEVLSQDWGTLKKTSFDYRRADGAWQRQVRESYDHGSAAAVLLFCPETRKVVLVRQFRYPIHAKGRDGWLLEVCAGLLDGDDPETCARREAMEETGYRLKTLRKAFEAEMSPGSLTEGVTCFVATYDANSRLAAGGGLEHEGEDIEVVELDFTEALRMLGDGRITDAKTILLLQYLALNPIA